MGFRRFTIILLSAQSCTQIKGRRQKTSSHRGDGVRGCTPDRLSRLDQSHRIKDLVELVSLNLFRIKPTLTQCPGDVLCGNSSITLRGVRNSNTNDTVGREVIQSTRTHQQMGGIGSLSTRTFDCRFHASLMHDEVTHY